MSADVSVAPDPAAEWWTTTDVANYLGVRVATVSTYRKREQMPLPDISIGRTHLWRPTRIIEWHAERPRPGVGGRRRKEDSWASSVRHRSTAGQQTLNGNGEPTNS